MHVHQHPNTITTEEVASYMLERGGFYTAALLRRELKLGIEQAAGKLWNIKTTPKYVCVSRGKPVEIKIIAIKHPGNTVSEKNKSLWHSLLTKPW